MFLKVLMLKQDDPRKCSAAKLVKFGLAKPEIGIYHINHFIIGYSIFSKIKLIQFKQQLKTTYNEHNLVE